MSARTKALANIITRSKADTDNTIAALRLQARAWRICAIKATVDPGAGVKDAKALLMRTVPFVDGGFVTRYIVENEALAEAAGKVSGVFARPLTSRERNSGGA